MKGVKPHGVVLFMMVWWLNVLVALALTATWRSVEVRQRLAQVADAQQASYAAEAGLRAGERAWPSLLTGESQGVLRYHFQSHWAHTDACHRRFYVIEAQGMAEHVQVRLRLTKVDLQQVLPTPECQSTPGWQHWERLI